MTVPEISLHVNNAPLTNVYPNTIETCLTPNHLLFGRELLYSSNTTSTLVTNLTVLPSTTDKIKCISNHFGDRWRHEYVVILRETQRTSKLDIKSLKINVNDIDTGIISSKDPEIRGAIVRIAKTNTILKRTLKQTLLN